MRLEEIPGDHLIPHSCSGRVSSSRLLKAAHLARLLFHIEDGPRVLQKFSDACEMNIDDQHHGFVKFKI